MLSATFGIRDQPRKWRKHLDYTTLLTLELIIFSLCFSTTESKSQRSRKSLHPEIERATVEWFKDKSARDANLTRPMLQQKALDFANTDESGIQNKLQYKQSCIVYEAFFWGI